MLDVVTIHAVGFQFTTRSSVLSFCSSAVSGFLARNDTHPRQFHRALSPWRTCCGGLEERRSASLQAVHRSLAGAFRTDGVALAQHLDADHPKERNMPDPSSTVTFLAFLL